MAKKENRVLVVGDIHLPYDKPGYLHFCKDVYNKMQCNKVVFIGDVVDLHAFNYHEKHPASDGPLAELVKARAAVKRWARAFPKATITVGNHDRLIIRKAATGGLPEVTLRTFNELWETPDWQWVTELCLDGVRYIHGDGAGGGLYPAYNVMRKTALSHVLGHHHTASGIKWLCNPERRLFGMDVGSGLEASAIQFLYQERNPVKPVISCGTVCGGIPQLWIMPCSRGEKYHDSKFRKTK